MHARPKLQGNSAPSRSRPTTARPTPIRRTLQPSEIADTVLFLASDRAAAITGESLGVDGGITRGIFL
jgi:NAD(P)-dependent dehydrogenase (short-subunit alcohol dehydrogenase family)